MKNYGRYWVATAFVAAVVAVLAMPRVATAAPQVISVSFDADTVGQSPATGGPGQPSMIGTFSGGTWVAGPSPWIHVESDAFGLNAKPVVMGPVSHEQAAFLGLNFPAVTHGLVRTEVTVSVDRFVDADFLQADDGVDLYLALQLSAQGEIRTELGEHGTTLGHYAPYLPFRMRMDIDLDAMSASIAVDDEMNGFADDPVLAGLPFSEDDADLQGVAGVYAGMGPVEETVEPVSAAYDDFVITYGTQVPGDLDRDGNVDRLDVAELMHAILNQSIPEEADADGDGSFTARDFKLILCEAGSHSVACGR